MRLISEALKLNGKQRRQESTEEKAVDRRKEKIICKQCKKEILKYPNYQYNRPRYFCSSQCSALYNVKIGKKNHFFGKTHSLKTRIKISKAGLGRKPNKETLLKLSIATTKEKNPNWNGGTYISDGRSYTRIDNVKDKKPYVFTHRLIVEKHIGRKLGRKEVVHHIDGNSLNNNINNLMVFVSNASHRRYHGNINNIKSEEILFDGRELCQK